VPKTGVSNSALFQKTMTTTTTMTTTMQTTTMQTTTTPLSYHEELKLAIIASRKKKKEKSQSRILNRLQKKALEESSKGGLAGLLIPTDVWNEMTEFEQTLFVQETVLRYVSSSSIGVSWMDILGITVEHLAGPMYLKAQLLFLEQRPNKFQEIDSAFAI
jgi:hypothetical protein